MLNKIINEIIYIFNESAIYILFGFLIAGILRIILPVEKVSKYLGKRSKGSVLLASILGIPLPLCSCAVLPTAMSLRKQGASKGATLSFMISTPETGVDSISITYALMDPIMTLFRPISALITAVTAGMLANRYGNDRKSDEKEEDVRFREESCVYHEAPEKGRLQEFFHYSFVELLNDIAFWLILSIVIAGFISALVPANFFERYVGSGITSMAIMLAFGIPIYMCAASSTPIAAALILKGLSPGAALVFLLTGPATNAGTIGAVGKFLGKRMMVIYLGTIAIVSIILGLILNDIYSTYNINPIAAVGTASELIPYSLKVLGSLTLLALILNNLWNIGFENALQSVNERLHDLTGFKITLSERYLEPILKSKETFVRLMPLIIIGVYLLSGLYTVQPGESGIIRRFGKVIEKDIKPGLHYKLPYPFDTLSRPKVSLIRRLSIGLSGGDNNNNIEEPKEILRLAGDENIVDTRFVIQYRIKDAYDYLFSVADSNKLTGYYAESAIMEIIGGEKTDNIITTGRYEVQERIKDILQTRLDIYSSGIQIVSVQLIYSHAPTRLHFAFRDVASAAEDKNTTINEAQKYRNDVISIAKGEAAKILLKAEAYKTKKITSATGEAEAFVKKAAEFKDAEDITITRMHIETMEKVLPNMYKILKPLSSSDNQYDLWFLNSNNTGGKSEKNKGLKKKSGDLSKDLLEQIQK